MEGQQFLSWHNLRRLAAAGAICGQSDPAVDDGWIVKRNEKSECPPRIDLLDYHVLCWWSSQHRLHGAGGRFVGQCLAGIATVMFNLVDITSRRIPGLQIEDFPAGTWISWFPEDSCWFWFIPSPHVTSCDFNRAVDVTSPSWSSCAGSLECSESTGLCGFRATGYWVWNDLH